MEDDDAASSLPETKLCRGREAAASASLRYWCVCNEFADARRSVRADDMVMSSLCRPKDDDAASSLPKGFKDGDAAPSLPDAMS